jgi:type I restriction enzyme M protein
MGQRNLDLCRDKTSLDIIWLKDKALAAALGNLLDPGLLAEEIIENLEAGVASFQQIVASLRK